MCFGGGGGGYSPIFLVLGALNSNFGKNSSLFPIIWYNLNEHAKPGFDYLPHFGSILKKKNVF